MTFFRSVKIFIHVIVFLAPILSMLGQEAYLDVDGLTKIRGRIDVNVMEDTSVVVIGRNAGINMTFSSSSMNNTFVGSLSGRANKW